MINLLIVDEHDYALRLSSVLSKNKDLAICIISDEKFNSIDFSKVDLVLVGSDYYERLKSIVPISKLLYMADDNYKLLNNTEGIYQIYKYQQISVIEKELFHYYALNSPSKIINTKISNTKHIAVHSTCGGSGKTTLSMSICKAIAAQNKRVLYLSFENYESTSFMFSNDYVRGMSELFKALNSEDEGVGVLSSVLQKDYRTNVFYIRSPLSQNDIPSLSKENIKSLIHCLNISNKFDYIVYDTTTAINEYTLELLEQVNKIFMVQLGSKISLHKLSVFIESSYVYEIYKDKIDIIINKFDKRTALNKFDIASEIPLLENLTYTEIINIISNSIPSLISING